MIGRKNELIKFQHSLCLKAKVHWLKKNHLFFPFCKPEDGTACKYDSLENLQFGKMTHG